MGHLAYAPVFFGAIGTTEWVIILVVALLLFGSRLPSISRSLGRSLGEFKKGLKDTKDELDKAADDKAPDGKSEKASPGAPEDKK